MLYLVATPIGNLSDMTFRAVEVLKSCDYILCEDTRHSRILTNHYNITTPLKSYHKFNEAAKENEIIQDLKENKSIALISDAGTPGISDPGQRLVEKCVKEHIRTIPIPGPCAAIAALSCSGLESERFQFIGFLPKQQKALKHLLQDLLTYAGTTICYESPHRLLALLELFHQLAPQRIIVVARELTKKFEELAQGLPQDLLQHFSALPVKGEIVVLIKGNEQKAADWNHLSPAEHVALLETTYQLSRQEAIKLAASQRDVPKREIYNKVQADRDGNNQ
jgi:16S rRNA (cytidine1402-2'-O)-methyltransferase